MPRLTLKDLEAMQARADLASPGPWYPWHRCSGVEETPNVNEVAGLGWEIVVNRDTGERAWPQPQLRGTFERGHDAYFVAHARQDVPTLVAEVRRLRTALEDIRESHCQDSETAICWCYDKAERALREEEPR